MKSISLADAFVYLAGAAFVLWALVVFGWPVLLLLLAGLLFAISEYLRSYE